LDETQGSDPGAQQDLHKQHFVQTVSALKCIKNNIRVVDPEELQGMMVDLPPPMDSNSKSNQSLS